MKRKVLIEKLQEAGFTLLRHGARHDIYARGKDVEQIPRHSDINEQLARHIIKKWRLV